MSQKESASRGSARMRLYIALGLLVLAAIYVTARLTMDPAPPVPPPLDAPAPGAAPGLGGGAPGLNGGAPGLNPNP